MSWLDKVKIVEPVKYQDLQDSQPGSWRVVQQVNFPDRFGAEYIIPARWKDKKSPHTYVWASEDVWFETKERAQERAVRDAKWALEVFLSESTITVDSGRVEMVK